MAHSLAQLDGSSRNVGQGDVDVIKNAKGCITKERDVGLRGEWRVRASLSQEVQRVRRVDLN